MRKFIQKLQNKPENVRKAILWISVVTAALILGAWWIFNVSRSIKEINRETVEQDLNMSGLKEDLENSQ